MRRLAQAKNRNQRPRNDDNLRPFIEVEWTNAGEMCAKIPMNARTFNAHKNTEIKTCPVRIYHK